MSTRYAPMLADVMALLAGISPARKVTRNWKDFAKQPQAELQAGIWIVRPAGTGPYPYETSDNGGATDGLRATQHAPLRITILGQQVLPANADGAAVDAAEFQMIHELEQLADAAIDTDGLEALRLVGDVQMSQQIECPYAWVHSTWEVSAL